jgi:hypothetical protein
MNRRIKLFENFVTEEILKNALELKPALQGYLQLSKDSQSSLYRNFQYGRAYVELDQQKAVSAGGNVSAFLFSNSPKTGQALMSLGGQAKSAQTPSGQLTDASGQRVNYYYYTMYSVPTDTETFTKFITSLNSVLTTGEVMKTDQSSQKSFGSYRENEMVFLANNRSVRIVSYDPVKMMYQVKDTSNPTGKPYQIKASDIVSRDFAASIFGDEFMSAYRSALASIHGGSGGKDTTNIIKAKDLMTAALAADPEMKAVNDQLNELTRKAEQEKKSIDQYPEKKQIDAKVTQIKNRILNDQRTKNPDVFKDISTKR